MQAPWAKAARPVPAPDPNLPPAPPTVIVDAQMAPHVETVPAMAPAPMAAAPMAAAPPMVAAPAMAAAPPIAVAPPMPADPFGATVPQPNYPHQHQTAPASHARAAENTDSLDVPPKNRAPLYALIALAVVVIGVLVAVFAL
jgi:hypothetical protein